MAGRQPCRGLKKLSTAHDSNSIFTARAARKTSSDNGGHRHPILFIRGWVKDYDVDARRPGCHGVTLRNHYTDEGLALEGTGKCPRPITGCGNRSTSQLFHKAMAQLYER